MIVRILGLMDTLSASLLALHLFIPLYWKTLLLFGTYHLLKAVVFRGDFHSLLDGIAGLLILASILILNPWLNLAFSLYLFQKGLVSLTA